MTLVLSGLRKGYPDFELGPIDLAVDREVLAVLGPSGGGKSTLLQTVAGVVAPDGGGVSLDGRSLDGRPPEDRGTVLLFQDGALFPHLTARENIAYAGADGARVDRLAAALEIGDVLDRPAPALSGGQRQRVALARALAADPGALLLDEPLANLDAPVKRRLRDAMRERLVGADVPVVYVTHDQREAAALGDRVAVLADGVVHQVGPPRAVFERPATPFVAAFTGGENVLRATVRRTEDPPVLDWRSVRLPVDPDVLDPAWGTETAVWVAVRPERLSLVAPGSGPDAGRAARPATALLSGHVTSRVYEGDREAVTVQVPAADAALTVAAPAGDPADPAETTRVQVRVDRSAVHVIGPVADDDGPGPLA